MCSGTWIAIGAQVQMPLAKGLQCALSASLLRAFSFNFRDRLVEHVEVDGCMFGLEDEHRAQTNRLVAAAGRLHA